MVVSVTYDHTTNTITVIGGTVGTPAQFSNLYTADKAGTQDLLHKKAITGNVALTALDHNLRPADYVLLGGAAQDLWIVIDTWTNMTSATVTLSGTDSADAAQTEAFAVTGNATIYATKYFKTLTQYSVTLFTKTDSGSFNLTIVQGQWGVVWRLGTYIYLLDAALVVGNGVDADYFTDSGRQIMLSDAITTTNSAELIKVTNAATLTLGVLVAEATRKTAQGCAVQTLETVNNPRIIAGDAGSVVYLYDCWFSAPSQTGASQYSRILLQGTSRVWNCHCGRRVALGDCPDVDLNNFYSTYGDYELFRCVGTMNNVTLHTMVSGAFLSSNNVAFNVSNITVLSTGYKIAVINSATTNYLINCISDTWNITWGAAGTIYRQYTMDIKVTDKSNVAIEGATVTLLDVNGTSIFNVATAADGTIATQTVSRGYYNQANGDTLQDYSPHTLTISKAGYQTYVKKFTLADKIVWEIKLAKAQPILFNVDGVKQNIVLNLKATDPENKIVLGL